jgi:hypothetical protein
MRIGQEYRICVSIGTFVPVKQVNLGFTDLLAAPQDDAHQARVS